MTLRPVVFGAKGDTETQRVGGGIRISPGKKGDREGDVSISLEGGVRRDVDDPGGEPRQQGEVGVRIEVPWPSPKD